MSPDELPTTLALPAGALLWIIWLRWRAVDRRRSLPPGECAHLGRLDLLDGRTCPCTTPPKETP